MTTVLITGQECEGLWQYLASALGGDDCEVRMGTDEDGLEALVWLRLLPGRLVAQWGSVVMKEWPLPVDGAFVAEYVADIFRDD